MFLGYNTNGLAHHELFDAVALLADLGYRGVAITIDHGVLSPRDEAWREQLVQLRRRLQQLNMRSVIETGARFLLDPREKHEPTLLSRDAGARASRLEFYQHAIRCAAELESDCVSLWSGVLREAIPYEQAFTRLVDGLGAVLDDAGTHGVTIGFEPEPGMLIDSMAEFDQLLGPVGDRLRLTLDIGHLQCQGETPIADVIRHWASRLVNVHLEDMRTGVHEHLMFGQGEIEFAPVLRALTEMGYEGGVYVELSRHSHEGPNAAQQAMEFLRPLLDATR